MQTVTVMPIATGASLLALRRTAVCRTVLTRKNVPSASNAKPPRYVIRRVSISVAPRLLTGPPNT